MPITKITTGVLSDGSVTASKIAPGVLDSVSGGAISWQSSVKTSNFTAAAGEGYFVDTTSAQVTITLPTSPTIGDLIGIIDYASTADTNKITVTSTKKILGNTADIDINYENGAVEFVFSGDAKGWLIASAANEGNTAISETPPEIDFVLIAGGGGGGNSNSTTHGGGGAGEYLAKTRTIVKSQNYTVAIGAGGGQNAAGSTSSFESSGAQSGADAFNFSLNGGGSASSPTVFTGGGSGCGGGEGINTGDTGTANELSEGSLVNDGGDYTEISGVTNAGAGGGGGAGATGSDGASASPGNGGTGAFSSITGTSVERAGGGGGGGFFPSGTSVSVGAGTGGGGNGGFQASSTTNSTAGAANTGGGGGGGCVSNSNTKSKGGGSGVFIVKYPDTSTINVGSGLTFSEDTSSVTGFKIATFTAGTDTVYWT